MDKVLDFSATEDTGITMTLTGEKTEGYIVYSVLNNTLVSKGGNRESTTTPTFTVENTVLADETYIVELSGIGYVPYKKSGVSFDEALSITNADFIPGDVNAARRRLYREAADHSLRRGGLQDPLFDRRRKL